MHCSDSKEVINLTRHSTNDLSDGFVFKQLDFESMWKNRFHTSEIRRRPIFCSWINILAISHSSVEYNNTSSFYNFGLKYNFPIPEFE